MKKSIKYIVLLTVLSRAEIIKSLESGSSTTNVASTSEVRTVNPVTIAAVLTVASSKKPRSLNRVVAFELPTLKFRRDKKPVSTPDQAAIVEWDSSMPAGRPRRASSFSDLRELAESTQARPAPGVHRSMRVMLVPEPIDLCGPRARSPLFDADSCAIEIGDTRTADSKATHAATKTKLTRTDSTHLSDPLEPVGAPKSTVVTTRASTSSSGHDPLVLALAASLKIYTEQNSEFLRNQAEQNRVNAEERNTTRRGVRDAKIIGAVATVGTLVGPYVAPYITALVKSWF
jgi:hypothetical protein